MIRRALALALAGLALLPAVAGALSVSDIAKQVRCPTCSTPLDVSNAPAALAMREYIAKRIDQGWSEERIIDDLVAQFGEGILATPPKRGFDLIAWLVPGILVAAGLAAPVARGGPRAAPADPRRGAPAGGGAAEAGRAVTVAWHAARGRPRAGR